MSPRDSFSIKWRDFGNQEVIDSTDSLFDFEGRLVKDNFNQNMETRTEAYNQEWNENNIYEKIHKDVELSALFKESKVSIHRNRSKISQRAFVDPDIQ